MAKPMAPDDILRACGYLEAMWREDQAAMDTLLQHRPGETPTATLLTDLGENILQVLLPGQFGITDDMSAGELAAAEEEFFADPTVRVSGVLLGTLKAFADGATPAQTEIIGRAVISFLVALSDTTEDDVLPLLATVRRGALEQYGTT
ncbi:hypothetical protein [Streptomyces sp. Da 82-17]|uniref:hypothetical protein n=1 Tax=Streptomyces sp. Da 82-17 TaxID=3377116 RepID=UPI0038D39218